MIGNGMSTTPRQPSKVPLQLTVSLSNILLAKRGKTLPKIDRTTVLAARALAAYSVYASEMYERSEMKQSTTPAPIGIPAAQGASQCVRPAVHANQNKPTTKQGPPTRIAGRNRISGAGLSPLSCIVRFAIRMYRMSNNRFVQ